MNTVLSATAFEGRTLSADGDGVCPDFSTASWTSSTIASPWAFRLRRSFG